MKREKIGDVCLSLSFIGVPFITVSIVGGTIISSLGLQVPYYLFCMGFGGIVWTFALVFIFIFLNLI